MILPNKNIEPKYSLFYSGAILLKIIKNKRYNIIDLWILVKKDKIMTYNKFIQTLVYLFCIGSINYTKKGEIYNENIEC
jgi:hypothetical protein